MRLDLDPESGLRDTLGVEAEGGDGAGQGPQSLEYSGVSSFSAGLARERVQEVILAALQQRLPRSRPLEVWEPQKLHARHISMLCDRSAGATAKEISQKYKMGQVYVNVILTHPDSLIILGALASLNADKMTDIGARLQGYAHEMLTGKIEIFRSTKDNRLKDSIASDVLDRAGYGPRQKVDLEATHRFVLPAAAAMSLSTALQEDQRVAVVDYSQFTGRKLGEAVQALESGETAQFAQVAPEQGDPVVSASPDASSESTENRRVA